MQTLMSSNGRAPKNQIGSCKLLSAIGVKANIPWEKAGIGWRNAQERRLVRWYKRSVPKYSIPLAFEVFW